MYLDGNVLIVVTYASSNKVNISIEKEKANLKKENNIHSIILQVINKIQTAWL